ncbi:DUF917 domain-containing protein [Histidinibacterium lentulum]|uniref:DUF917 domain-containing protein n=1 Tax=Histidinibacterium lentulum TaxID=2480588 RepID=A0A3N2R9Z9_9RHOB|nr:DUF917 domain-containing protein [Histidinibacterium lentulum]ROU04176.1 DUF917 domain-containing protein [Histidinibacterium lentulum]
MADVLREVTDTDLDAIEIGAAILGTGGGGNPYIGKLRCREELKKGRRIPVIPLSELADNALVVSLGGMGAPVVGVEKIEQGEECLRALKAIEKETGRRVDALISAEIGGANSMEPMLTAAQAGLPVVDGDGMGRAFPEMQMTTWSIYGHRAVPAAMADEKGNIVVIRDTPTDHWLEHIARAAVVPMGAACGLATAPMSGAFVKRVAIPNTITQALNLGRAVLHAHRAHLDPIRTVIEQENGRLLMTAKIVDLERHLKGGFAVGHLTLEGFGDFAGESGHIDLQNEFLVFRRGGVVEACVPDLIVVLDSDTGLPITTEMLRYGQRIAVLGLPCHDLLRSPEALEIVGPAAFGYPDITYEPMPAAGGRAA